MFEKVLPPRSRELLVELAHSQRIDDFYLAGGTAAALMLGHRLSEDLDFFTEKTFNPLTLEDGLRAFGELYIVNQEAGSLTARLAGVKTSWLEYPYRLLEAPTVFLGAEIAGLLDVGLMKLTAISSRGSKRDFVDVKVICDALGGLKVLIEAMPKKYEGINYNSAHLFKSLVYFDDADAEPDPRMLVDLQWPTVKAFFEEQVRTLIEKDE